MGRWLLFDRGARTSPWHARARRSSPVGVAVLSAIAIVVGAVAPAASAVEVAGVETIVGPTMTALPPNPPVLREAVAMQSTRDRGTTILYDVSRPATGEGPRPLVMHLGHTTAKGVENLHRAANALGWISLYVDPPQIPDYHYFLGHKAYLLYLEILEDARRRYSIESSQVYVGGCSKGAVAGVGIAYLYPDLFAGAYGDSGTYDQGFRGTVGVAAQATGPAPIPPLPNAANPLSVVAAAPDEAPWAWDAFSALQLSGDPLPNSDQHGAAYPEYVGVGHPGEAQWRWNAAAMPTAIAAGGTDTTSPAALTGVPFVNWIGPRGYRTRYQIYPTGGHCEMTESDPGSIYGMLDWLADNRAPDLPREVAYQSADVVNPEPRGLDSWPFYDLTGSKEGDSLPLQAARHDRGYGLKIGDPYLYRLRVGFVSPGGKRWDGTLRVDGGQVLSTSGIDDGVGLVGKRRALPGSVPLTPPRRGWLEAGETAADASWQNATDGAAGDAWDMVAFDIEAVPGARLTIDSAGLAEPERVSLRELREAVTDGQPRTLDLAAGGGTIRLQVLQSHRWWWSQIRAVRNPELNQLDISVRDVASEAVDLTALGLSTSRPLLVSLEGREYTGANELVLTGDWASDGADVTVDGHPLGNDDHEIDGGELRIRLDDIAGRKRVIEVSPRAPGT